MFKGAFFIGSAIWEVRRGNDPMIYCSFKRPEVDISPKEEEGKSELNNEMIPLLYKLKHNSPELYRHIRGILKAYFHLIEH